MTRWRGLASKVRRARRVGLTGLAQRLAQHAYIATGAADLRFNLRLDDILSEVPASLPLPAIRPAKGTPISIGWLMTPPAPGSGGHTTLFRMIEALEARGHRCTVYIYDKHGVDTAELTRRIRRHWPSVASEICDVSAGISGVDAIVATSWESAHLVVKYGLEPARRMYFLQDYEPYFYGHGAEYELAAMTYRLPFRRIVLGEMLDGMLREATGLSSDVVPFGCDSEVYRPPAAGGVRAGVVFYCRPDFPRRGYHLAAVALREFNRLHPDQQIHVYGAAPRGLEIPHVFHGRLTTAELNALYGRTIAGLALSFTNITLVAEEMLAAGNIPVVNDMALARLVLPNPHVRWVEPTGSALAHALSGLVTARDIDAVADAAADSVGGRSWQPTHEAVVRIVEEEVYGE